MGEIGPTNYLANRGENIYFLEYYLKIILKLKIEINNIEIENNDNKVTSGR